MTEDIANLNGYHWQTVSWAIHRINMYHLVDDGSFTYAELGFPHIDGVILSKIVKEHITISGLLLEARREREILDNA